MSTHGSTNLLNPASAGDDTSAQREPTLADIYKAVMDIGHRVTVVEQDLAAQKNLSSIRPGEGSVFGTPPTQTAAGTASQEVRFGSDLQTALGLTPTGPTNFLQAGRSGGPYGLTPTVTENEKRHARARPSMGVSGFPLPPQASPTAYRGQLSLQSYARPAPTPYRSAPRDSDPTMKGIKEDLFVIHQDYVRSTKPEWTEEQVHREATQKTAEDYLAMRKRAIEETLAGTVAPAKTASHHQDSGRTYRRVNWDMVKIITKLGMDNWSDWRSSLYSLLGTVPGAIGILEGTIFGPLYLGPNDFTSHPDYDEALDLELGQVIQSCTEPSAKSLLLKTTSEQELRGSFFYRDLRNWLVPNQGYAALKLIAKMGRHRQREEESVREFGERLRRFYLELQSAGENLDQTKQVGFLLAGLRFRFQTVRDSVVSRQATGEVFTFEKALQILAETEESFDAFDDRRRNAPATRSVPPLSRPSAHFAEPDTEEDGFDTDLDDEEVQAFAAHFARQFVARRKAGYGKPFTGACFVCKKTGHRAAECPENQEAKGQGPPHSGPSHSGSTARA
ncbi:unnamed protein product, partial [Tilletia controversa]